MATRIPLVVVIAGPNGAGKTTSASRLLLGALAVNEFVNADTIAVGLSAFRPEEVAVAAGRLMLARLRELARERKSFAFETTLASLSFAPWLRTLKAEGYRVHLVFLSLPSAEMAIARVQDRARRGGHHIPEDVVRRRFVGGLRNFFGNYRGIADEWRLYDNSPNDGPRPIASGGEGSVPNILDAARWNALLEQSR